MATPTPGGGSTSWWRAMAGYEVYLRSFADGDGDGIGDLVGLCERLEHLAWLGVDLVWITPFYPSPMADHGYDITDHRAVDPRYGSLADLDAVIGRAHDLGLRVLIDIVPNHTSSEHPWFEASRSSRSSSRRSWYHWRDGAAEGEPPNNWLSYFGGPAWTFEDATGQWFCHLFLPEQPDLNWAEAAVADEFDEIFRFWLDRGVDGFRIDVAQGLAKDPSFADNPLRPGGSAGTGARAEFARQDHRHDIAQPASREIFRRWRRLTDDHDAVLLGEVYLPDPADVAPYVAGDGLHLAFTFAFAALPWDAAAVRAALVSTFEHLGERACWTQASHDEPRPPTRFGGGERGRARAMAITTLLAGMPGTLVLYQGEELALEDGDVPAEHAQDPLGDRDGCRTPMPWAPVPGWGFTSASEPWLPFGDVGPSDTVAVQRDDDRSWLNLHRRLLGVRRRFDVDAPVRWGRAGAVVSYRRGDHQIAAAIHDAAQTFDPGPGAWRIVFSSKPDRALGEVADLTLAPAEAVVLERAGPEPAT